MSVDGWTFDPLEFALIAAGCALAARRASRRRPRPLEAAAFAGALGLVVAALVSPIAQLGAQRFSAHMGAHLLLGDVGPLVCAVSLRRSLPPDGRLRQLAHPAALLAFWAADLYGWHVRAAYEAALHHTPVHALQHTLLFAAGTLGWLVVLGALPARGIALGWRFGFVVAQQALMTGLGMAFVWSPRAFYPTYVEQAAAHGFSAVADQRVGGLIMLAEGTLVLAVAFAWLFLRTVAGAEPARASRQDAPPAA